MKSATVDAYRSACDFIVVGDVMRTLWDAGMQVPEAMYWELREARYHLDRALRLRDRELLTDAEWDVLVRMRLTNRERLNA